MNILAIAPYYSIRKRGAESVVRTVKNNLSKKNIKIVVDHFFVNELYDSKTFRKKFKYSLENFLDKSYVSGAFKKFLGIEPSLLSFYFYKERLESFGYYKLVDLLWNNSEYFCSLLCKRVREKYGIPFVTTFHGNPSQLMVNMTNHKPNAMIVLAPFYKQFLEKRFKDVNIVCIPNGVNLKIFSPQRKPIKDYLNQLEHPIFLSTSALVPSKRVDLIVKAIAKLKRGSLIVSSDGSQKNKIVKLGKRLLGNRFIYTGRISDEFMPNLYRTADYYVTASTTEGHSIAVLEALASNLPVIAHDSLIQRWTIGNAGLLTNIRNEKDLYKVLLLELTSPNSWNSLPRKRARKFDISKTIETYKQLFESVGGDR